MHIATVETRHFSFIALGETEEQAKKVLMQGWAVHCEETGASKHYITDDDINVTELDVGQCARDHSVLWPRQPCTANS